MKLDFLGLSQNIPLSKLRHSLLNRAFEVAIPFNRKLGLQIEALSASEAVIRAPERRRRKNHVGSAHACFLALLGEYPAGLLIAENFSIQEYRPIIGKLQVDYHKQGFGSLKSICFAPKHWPRESEGEFWVDMVSEISDEKGASVATCKTRWQVKRWDKIRN